MEKKTVCIWCGASNTYQLTHKEVAIDLVNGLAARGLNMVYGGGNQGLMGVIGNAAYEANVHTIAITIEFLDSIQGVHPHAQHQIITSNMAGRKLKMFEHADAFIALPGGYGTLDEITELLTHKYVGLCESRVPGLCAGPLVLLNINHYWDPLIKLIDHIVDQGYVDPQYRHIFHVATTPNEALDYIEQEWRKLTC